MPGNDIADKVLNDPQFRSALRSAIPEVDKLEALAGTVLEDLTLRSAIVEGSYFGGGELALTYAAKPATQHFYADPTKALIEAGVIDPAKHDPIRINTSQEGEPGESKFVELYRENLELCIDILKPNSGYDAKATSPVAASVLIK